MITLTSSAQPAVSSASTSRPLALLAITWLVIPILLWLSAHGTFSFQGPANNSTDEASLVQTVSEQDTIASRIQKAMTAPLLLMFAFPFLSNAIRVFKTNQLFTTLAALTVVSIVWSQFPVRSMAFSLDAVLCIFFALCFYERFSAEDQLRLIYWTGIVVVVSSLAMIVLLPQYATYGGSSGHGEWKGIFHTKNVLARACVFLLTPALFSYNDRRISRVSRLSYVLVICLVIFMSASKTGLIDAAACILFCFAIRFVSRVAKKEALFLLVFGVGVVAAATVIIIQYAPLILLALGKDSTLTGRTDIWGAVMESIMKRPILGYGYGGFWWGTHGEAYNIDSRVGWMVPYAHNGFLDIWLELGAVGLALVIATFIKAIRDGMRSLRGERSFYVQWCLSIVFLTVLYNLDEGTLLAQTELVWVLYVVACTGLAMEAKRIRGHSGRAI